jgi:hypothetical protein
VGAEAATLVVALDLYNRGAEYSLKVLVFTYLLLGMQFLEVYQDAGWGGGGAGATADRPGLGNSDERIM